MLKLARSAADGDAEAVQTLMRLLHPADLALLRLLHQKLEARLRAAGTLLQPPASLRSRDGGSSERPGLNPMIDAAMKFHVGAEKERGRAATVAVAAAALSRVDLAGVALPGSIGPTAQTVTAPLIPSAGSASPPVAVSAASAASIDAEQAPRLSRPLREKLVRELLRSVTRRLGRQQQQSQQQQPFPTRASQKRPAGSLQSAGAALLQSPTFSAKSGGISSSSPPPSAAPLTLGSSVGISRNIAPLSVVSSATSSRAPLPAAAKPAALAAATAATQPPRHSLLEPSAANQSVTRVPSPPQRAAKITPTSGHDSTFISAPRSTPTLIQPPHPAHLSGTPVTAPSLIQPPHPVHLSGTPVTAPSLIQPPHPAHLSGTHVTAVVPPSTAPAPPAPAGSTPKKKKRLTRLKKAVLRARVDAWLHIHPEAAALYHTLLAESTRISTAVEAAEAGARRALRTAALRVLQAQADAMRLRQLARGRGVPLQSPSASSYSAVGRRGVKQGRQGGGSGGSGSFPPRRGGGEGAKRGAVSSTQSSSSAPAAATAVSGLYRPGMQPIVMTPAPPVTPSDRRLRQVMKQLVGSGKAIAPTAAGAAAAAAVVAAAATTCGFTATAATAAAVGATASATTVVDTRGGVEPVDSSHVCRDSGATGSAVAQGRAAPTASVMGHLTTPAQFCDVDAAPALNGSTGTSTSSSSSSTCLPLTAASPLGCVVAPAPVTSFTPTLLPDSAVPAAEVVRSSSFPLLGSALPVTDTTATAADKTAVAVAATTTSPSTSSPSPPTSATSVASTPVSSSAADAAATALAATALFTARRLADARISTSTDAAALKKLLLMNTPQQQSGGGRGGSKRGGTSTPCGEGSAGAGTTASETAHGSPAPTTPTHVTPAVVTVSSSVFNGPGGSGGSHRTVRDYVDHPLYPQLDELREEMISTAYFFQERARLGALPPPHASSSSSAAAGLTGGGQVFGSGGVGRGVPHSKTTGTTGGGGGGGDGGGTTRIVASSANKRRIVIGLREVARGCRTGRIKLVVIAPNIEGGGEGAAAPAVSASPTLLRSASAAATSYGASSSSAAAPTAAGTTTTSSSSASAEQGSLDEAVASIGAAAAAADPPVPIVFGLTRKRMGRALGKSVRTSVVGLYSFENLRGLPQRAIEAVGRLRRGEGVETVLPLPAASVGGGLPVGVASVAPALERTRAAARTLVGLGAAAAEGAGISSQAPSLGPPSRSSWLQTDPGQQGHQHPHSATQVATGSHGGRSGYLGDPPASHRDLSATAEEWAPKVTAPSTSY